jgi:hypothetical protein
LELYDLIGQLKSYADTQGWCFLYGDNFHQNYEATRQDIRKGDLILGADPFLATPSITQSGKVESIIYTGLIMLGRKYEDTSISSLDETYYQKYVNRLKELMQLLSTHLISFSCDNELTIESSQFELSINRLDENVDFVICSITLRDDR